MRQGVTLLELAVVLAIIGVLCALGIPRLLRFMDRSHVRHATNEIVTAMAVARTAAVTRQAHVTVRFDRVRSAVTVISGTDTLLTRELGAVYGISLLASRDSSAYAPTGLGYGAANQTVVVTRGDVMDSVIISRLGRVRR